MKKKKESGIDKKIYSELDMMMGSLEFYGDYDESKKSKSQPLKERQSQKSDVRKKAAVMFADVRNFSTVVQELDARDVVIIINKYVELIDRCVKKNNGTLSNVMGDTTMAYWLDDETDGRAAFLACKAAMDLSKESRALDEEIYKTYGKEIVFGIGVNYGDCVVGYVGVGENKTLTVLGETVSKASHLENIAAKGCILIPENLRRILGNKINVTELSHKVTIKGHNEPESIYILDSFSEDKSILDEPLNVLRRRKERYTLSILGCRGSYQVSGKRFNEFGGQTTCSVLKIDKHAIVLDCGTGFYNARNILSDCTKVDVLLSHVHYDHCLGLLDWSVFPKGIRPDIYGNFRAWRGMRTINELFAAPFWPVDLVSGSCHQVPDWGRMLYLGDDITVRFYPSAHPNGAMITHIVADDKNIVIMVDCEQPDAMPFDVVKDCDILIYDGMYDNLEYQNKVGWGHSTWQMGCELALKAGVKQLIIAHHSPQRSDADLLELERYAKNVFQNTIFAREGMVIKL